MKSQLKDQIRLTELLRASDYKGVVAHIEKFPNILREVCVDNNKGHCNHNPLYAAIVGPEHRMTEPFINFALQQNPELLNIITHRSSLLSYLTLNKDDPMLVRNLLDRGVDINDQSDYSDMNFRIYKPSFNTAAHNAVMRGHVNSLKALIENDADLSLQNVGKATVMDVYFYNSYRLGDEIGKVLADAEADVSHNRFGYSTSLTRAINNKEWDLLDKILDYTKAKLSKFQLDRMVSKMSDDEITPTCKSVLGKALGHMADDFDVEKYAEHICKTVADFENCKELFSKEQIDVEHEPLVSGVDFMDLREFSALVEEDRFGGIQPTIADI